MRTISQRAAAVGLIGQIEPYDYTNAQAIVDWIKTLPQGVQIFLIGDSCGANILAWIAAEVAPRKLAGIFPVQASVYCNSNCPPIGANVENASIVFSDWVHTGGLGVFQPPLLVPPTLAEGEDLYDGKWRVGNNGKTKVRYLYVPAAHPDDNDVSYVQNPIFACIKQIQNEAAVIAASQT
jgi:acetyl esterase/lipase